MSEVRKMPKRVAKGAPTVDRETMHTVVAGMGVVRKQLFSSPINHDGWQKAMLTHIGAAKQLGFTMFEIDVLVELRPRRKEKKQESDGAFGISSMLLFGRAPVVEGDEWKAVAEPVVEEQHSPLVDTPVVYVYALAVE